MGKALLAAILLGFSITASGQSTFSIGSLPLPEDRNNPTDAEVDAIQAKIVTYQAVFDAH